MERQKEVFDNCSPIFIVGSTRSGTTLTRSILSAHPNIAIADGFHYWVEVAHFKSAIPDLKAPGAIDKLFDLLSKSRHHVHIADLDADLAEVRTLLAQDPDPTLAKYFRHAMETYARRRGALRFGEKTSANVRYLPQVQEMFPKAKILNLVRDPRANIASHLHVPWASRDVVSLALKWKLAVRSFLDFQAQGPEYPENVMEVRYEDLVAEPETVIRRICAFIDEPYDARMLAHQEHSGIQVSALPWKTGVARPIYQTATQKWQQELSAPRIALIQWLTAREMRHYGYQPLQISAQDRLRVPAQLLREVRLWLQFKRRMRAERQGTGPQYYDDSRVYRLMLGLLGKLSKPTFTAPARPGGPPSPATSPKVAPERHPGAPAPH